MPPSIESSSTYGEAIKGVGVKFSRSKKKKKKKHKSPIKGKVAYHTFD